MPAPPAAVARTLSLLLSLYTVYVVHTCSASSASSGSAAAAARSIVSGVRGWNPRTQPPTNTPYITQPRIAIGVRESQSAGRSGRRSRNRKRLRCAAGGVVGLSSAALL